MENEKIQIKYENAAGKHNTYEYTQEELEAIITVFNKMAIIRSEIKNNILHEA